MKFGLAFVLGILIFSAGIQGDLGSILAAIIDPGALSEVTGSTTPNPYANVPPGGTPKAQWPATLPLCPVSGDCSCYPQQRFTGGIRYVQQGNQCVKV